MQYESSGNDAPEINTNQLSVWGRRKQKRQRKGSGGDPQWCRKLEASAESEPCLPDWSFEQTSKMPASLIASRWSEGEKVRATQSLSHFCTRHHSKLRGAELSRLMAEEGSLTLGFDNCSQKCLKKTSGKTYVMSLNSFKTKCYQKV